MAYSGPQPLQERADRVRRARAEQERLIAAEASGEITPAEFVRMFAASQLEDQAVAVSREP
jgi:hypothetical protein